MSVSGEFDLSKSQPDFLITECTSLRSILADEMAHPHHGPPLAVVCLGAELIQKDAIEANIAKQVTALGWVIEAATQPCGPRKLARVLVDLQRRRAEASARHLITRSKSTLPTERLKVIEAQPLVHRSMSNNLRKSTVGTDTYPKIHSSLLSEGMPVSSANVSPILPLGSPANLGPGDYFSPRVLLVDDNAINLKLLIVFARRQKLQYSEAMNSLSALDQYKKDAFASSKPVKPFNVVLMDILMPVIDGLESTRQIRRFKAENNLPQTTIVALTSLASAQDQQDAVNAGVDMYLVKPVKFTDIKRLFSGK